LAEYKCDIDNAISSLGRKFRGTENKGWKEFGGYPDIQRIIIADILWGDYSNYTLYDLGEKHLIYLRKDAYKKMCDYLNGLDIKK
jgi:hypothetical protein